MADHSGMSTIARFAVRYRFELCALVLAVAVIVGATIALVDVLAVDWPTQTAPATTPSVELPR